MDVVIFVLSLLVLCLALAVFSNKFRRAHRLHFDLKPNCLLTRWPIVFLTGPRSLFYFSRYWNLYPVFLAEHGYEVFTVHMPWQSPEPRRAYFKKFLEVHAGKKYHFVVDAVTLEQLKDLFWASSVAVSVTELRNAGTEAFPANSQLSSVEMLESTDAGLLLKTSFALHQHIIKIPKTATLSTMGALPGSAINNSLLLLTKMQTLAESDYQEDLTL